MDQNQKDDDFTGIHLPSGGCESVAMGDAVSAISKTSKHQPVLLVRHGGPNAKKIRKELAKSLVEDMQDDDTGLLKKLQCETHGRRLRARVVDMNDCEDEQDVCEVRKLLDQTSVTPHHKTDSSTPGQMYDIDSKLGYLNQMLNSENRWDGSWVFDGPQSTGLVE